MGDQQYALHSPILFVPKRKPGFSIMYPINPTHRDISFINWQYQNNLHVYYLFQNVNSALKKFPSQPSTTSGSKGLLIDVVPYKVIWAVNWLHYLNYEPTTCTSSTRHLVRTRNVLGQTVSSYGWCNGIPRVVPLFRFFSELFASDRLSYWG